MKVRESCEPRSCTLDRGNLLGKFTPSLARSFFSSSLSTSSCRECWGLCLACEADGQNIPVKAVYPRKVTGVDQFIKFCLFDPKGALSRPRQVSSEGLLVNYTEEQQSGPSDHTVFIQDTEADSLFYLIPSIG